MGLEDAIAGSEEAESLGQGRSARIRGFRPK